MKRALVTGTTGFIGGHLARTLTADGVEVLALTRAAMPATATELIDVVADFQPDVAFHLATHFVGAHKPEDVEPLIAANVLFGTQLAEALRVTPPRVLVNVGTVWQHDETGGYHAAALYAATKQAMEDILRYYADAGAFRVANVKLYDTYGPGDTRGKLLSILDRAAQTGTALDLSPGEQLIDLLHVDDVVAALRAAADAADAPWQAWSASSGQPLKLKDLVETFATLTRRSVPVRWGARPYRAREMFTLWPAGPRVPGWEPRIALEDGIRAIWCP